MINAKKMSFENWTEYDDWLVKNYSENSIFCVNEISGKIEVEYCAKDEFQAEMKREEEEKEKAEKSKAVQNEKSSAPEKNTGAN